MLTCNCIRIFSGTVLLGFAGLATIGVAAAQVSTNASLGNAAEQVLVAPPPLIKGPDGKLMPGPRPGTTGMIPDLSTMPKELLKLPDGRLIPGPRAQSLSGPPKDSHELPPPLISTPDGRMVPGPRPSSQHVTTHKPSGKVVSTPDGLLVPMGDIPPYASAAARKGPTTLPSGSSTAGLSTEVKP